MNILYTVVFNFHVFVAYVLFKFNRSTNITLNIFQAVLIFTLLKNI